MTSIDRRTIRGWHRRHLAAALLSRDWTEVRRRRLMLRTLRRLERFARRYRP